MVDPHSDHYPHAARGLAGNERRNALCCIDEFFEFFNIFAKDDDRDLLTMGELEQERAGAHMHACHLVLQAL